MERIKAWHFTSDKLRDGRPIPKIGEVLYEPEPIRICSKGLHASIDPFDALIYAPGDILHQVEIFGTLQRKKDKICGSKRVIIKSVDFEPHLRKFARQQALKVIHLWNPPAVVLEYLKTGKENLRDAARGAAWDAAMGAAWGAARDAAWSAAWSAARGAAMGAAWGAARDAARGAARGAAWSAAWSAARGAARSDFNNLVKRVFNETDT